MNKPYTLFLGTLNDKAIQQAIESAESKTSANIVLRISKRRFGNPLKRAKKSFVKAGLHQHPQHNCVMIYIMPYKKKIAIVGDTEIDKAVGQAYWDARVQELTFRFHRGDVNSALRDCITQVGQLLATKFPYSGKRDNISNEIQKE